MVKSNPAPLNETEPASTFRDDCLQGPAFLDLYRFKAYGERVFVRPQIDRGLPCPFLWTN